MSGHSKWSTIKRKKEKTDAQRAKIFTKISREIAVCVREHGGDVNTNSKLKDLIQKARSNNIPADNIERLISKVSGGQDKNNYEEMLYEGYDPSGIAVMVSALTSNRNRTAGDLRHYFDKFGGNLGQTGSVGFMFKKVGAVTIEQKNLSEEQLLMDILDLDVDDWQIEEDMAIIFVAENKLAQAKAEISKKYNVIDADFEYKPTTVVSVTDEESLAKMEKLLDALENNDDVQKVWHNLADNEEQEGE